MRHDPASAAVVVMLKALKLYGMAQAVGDLIEQGAPAFGAAVPMLSQLLKAEMAEREVRSIAYQIKAARFPAYKDLAGFDFASSEANEALVRQLHGGEFIDGADNVVLIGGPGTGKSHIATALGVQAVEHHRKKVRFFATVDLVNALEQEKAANKAGQIAERLLKLDLIILDELGYLPFSSSGGALLFNLLRELTLCNQIHHLSLAIGQRLVSSFQFGIHLERVTAHTTFRQAAVDGVEEVLIPERLCQEFDGASLHGADRHGNVTVRRDKHDRNFSVRLR